mmetsp:Transcript_41484/g.133904  ORF Transcript_41484/g.133904 Transcript_41484/m.133904 type:complete len:949 (+) Transcript_41484:3-2849(+)
MYPWCRITNHRKEAIVIRPSGKEGREVLIPSGGHSVCLKPEQRSSVLSIQVRHCSASGQRHWSQPIQLARALVGHRGYLRHVRSGGKGHATCVFDITAVEVGWDATSDFLSVDMKPSSESVSPYLFENGSKTTCFVKQAGCEGDCPDVPLLPGERVPFIPLGLKEALAGQCMVQIFAESSRASGHEDEEVLLDIEKHQTLACGPVHIEVFKERPRRILIRDAQVVFEANRRRLQRENTAVMSTRFIACHLLGRGAGQLGRRSVRWALQAARKTEGAESAQDHQDVEMSPQAASEASLGASPCAATWSADKQLIIASLVPRQRQRLQTAPRTPRTPLAASSAWHSPRRRSRMYPTCHTDLINQSHQPSPSVSDSLRKGSSDVFWQRHRNLRQQRAQSITHRGELQAEGFGVALIDVVALQEVAYISAKCLNLKCVTRRGEGHELDVGVGSVHVDIKDSSGSKSGCSVMLQPWRGRFKQVQTYLGKQTEAREAPFISLHMRWRDMDPRAGKAAHLQVDEVSLDVRSVEACLDAESCFRLAHWALGLADRMSPAFSSSPAVCSHDRRDDLVWSLLRSASACSEDEGAADDPFLGEPHCPTQEDFAVPTPVFIKRLLVRSLRIVLSVHFGGRQISDCQGNEALQAADFVLRRLIPFDVSQAHLTLGAPSSGAQPPPDSSKTDSWRWFRRRRCCWCCRRAPDRDAILEDRFLAGGLQDFLSRAAQDVGAALVKQVPHLIGSLFVSQRIIGSPRRLATELKQSIQLVYVALRTCDFWVLVGAVLMGVAALFESAEGVLMVLANTFSRPSTGTLRWWCCLDGLGVVWTSMAPSARLSRVSAAAGDLVRFGVRFHRLTLHLARSVVRSRLCDLCAFAHGHKVAAGRPLVQPSLGVVRLPSLRRGVHHACDLQSGLHALSLGCARAVLARGGGGVGLRARERAGHAPPRLAHEALAG